ncbi:MAG: hypothetical protein ACYTFW_07545 [Planctomycetota bacterium]
MRLGRPVLPLYAPNRQIRIRQPIPSRPNLLGLEVANLAVNEKEVAPTLPAPPSFIIIYKRMVAEPFG